MKNKLIDLNNHLFAQLERLSDEDIEDEKLTAELSRTKAITSVAVQIISNARLALNAQVAIKENMMKKPPEMIGLQCFDANDYE